MSEEEIKYKVVDGVKSVMTPEEIAQFLADIEAARATVGGSD